MSRDYHMLVTKHYITVDRKKVDIEEVALWVKNNCASYVSNNYHANYHGNDYIDFFFMPNEKGRKDMSVFLLRWA